MPHCALQAALCAIGTQAVNVRPIVIEQLVQLPDRILTQTSLSESLTDAMHREWHMRVAPPQESGAGEWRRHRRVAI